MKKAYYFSRLFSFLMIFIYENMHLDVGNLYLTFKDDNGTEIKIKEYQDVMANPTNRSQGEWLFKIDKDNSTKVSRDKIVAISNADDVLKEKYHKIAVNYEILDKEADDIAKNIEKDPRESSISTSDKIQKRIKSLADFYTKNKTIHWMG